jgi:hypothetical protein
MTDLLALPLCRLDRPVKIRSRLLDAFLWLVPPGWAGQDLDAPAYTHEECRLLLALELLPAELKALHLAKTTFQGDVVLASEAEELRPLYRKFLRRYRDLEKRLAAGEQAVKGELLQVARHLSRLLSSAPQLETDP